MRAFLFKSDFAYYGMLQEALCERAPGMAFKPHVRGMNVVDFMTNITYDEIKKAAHYQPDAHPSQLECIVMVEDMDFCIGNGLKYIYRAGKKPGEERTKTLAKAEYYFRRKAARLSQTAHRIVPPWLSHEVRQGLHRWACSGAPEASIVQNVLQAYADPVRGYWEMVKAADRCVELMQNGEGHA